MIQHNRVGKNSSSERASPKNKGIHRIKFAEPNNSDYKK